MHNSFLNGPSSLLNYVGQPLHFQKIPDLGIKKSYVGIYVR